MGEDSVVTMVVRLLNSPGTAESSGWTKKSIESMLGLFDDIRAGTNSDSMMGDTIKPILGRPGISFRQFAEDYASII